MRRSFLSSALASLFFTITLPAFACDGTTALPSAGAMALETDAGSISAHVAAPGHNVGVYHFDPALQAFVLVNSWFDPVVAAAPITPQPGDVIYREFGGSGGDGGGVVQSAGCDDIPKLAPVIVTAQLPRVFFFRRIISGGGGSNPIRDILRPGVRVEYIEIEPQSLTCESHLNDRYFAVYDAVRGEDGTGFDVAGLFLVQFSPGNRQWWRCRNMGMSTCELEVATGCSADPARPSE